MHYLRIILFFIILFFSSCVKEERDGCPASIDFDFISYFDKPTEKVYVITDSELDLAIGEYNETDLDNNLSVRRGLRRVGTVSGIVSSELSDGLVLIPEGSQCDSLYGSSAVVSCLGEVILYTPEAQKQFATIRVKLIDECFDTNHNYFTIVSDVDGVNMLDMKPHKGNFKFNIVPNEDGICKFRMPRQFASSEPLLHLCEGEEVFDTYRLYSWLEASGYDWTAPNLDDIDITLERKESGVQVTVTIWNSGGDYVIEL